MRTGDASWCHPVDVFADKRPAAGGSAIFIAKSYLSLLWMFKCVSATLFLLKWRPSHKSRGACFTANEEEVHPYGDWQKSKPDVTSEYVYASKGGK
jgi:hypothetical protein